MQIHDELFLFFFKALTLGNILQGFNCRDQFTIRAVYRGSIKNNIFSVPAQDRIPACSMKTV
jgi:hypothetical protein